MLIGPLDTCQCSSDIWTPKEISNPTSRHLKTLLSGPTSPRDADARTRFGPKRPTGARQRNATFIYFRASSGFVVCFDSLWSLYVCFRFLGFSCIRWRLFWSLSCVVVRRFRPKQLRKIGVVDFWFCVIVFCFRRSQKTGPNSLTA